MWMDGEATASYNDDDSGGGGYANMYWSFFFSSSRIVWICFDLLAKQ